MSIEVKKEGKVEGNGEQETEIRKRRKEGMRGMRGCRGRSLKKKTTMRDTSHST